MTFKRFSSDSVTWLQHRWFRGRSCLPVLCCLLWVVALAGCTGERSSDESSDVVYVDTRTGAAIVAPASTVLPSTNPTTGEQTLMPGLYCFKCNKWYVSPPDDVLNRNPGGAICQKDGTALTRNGPRPEANDSVAGSQP
jgi:hypothetical protein